MFARLAPLGLVLLSSTAFAQVLPTAPFDGELLHDFSSNPIGKYKTARSPIANITASSLQAYDVRATYESATCGSIAPEYGDHVLFTNEDCVGNTNILRVNFRNPVLRFGAYIMGGETEPLQLLFRFGTGDGQALGEHNVVLPPGCGWHWVGFEIQGGVGADRLALHNPYRGKVVLDAMTADLEELPPVGTSFCDSRSAAPQISGFGSTFATDASLRLRAERVPSDYGLFFYGDHATAVPFGNGTRCVGGAGGVVRVPAVTTDAGVLTGNVDVAADPRLSAGTTWYFQLVYRDADAGGTGFDVSNGLEVTFE